MKQREINQLIISLIGLNEPLADRHTSKQLEKLCTAIVEEFEDSLDELRDKLMEISGFEFLKDYNRTRDNYQLRLSRKSWRIHYFFDEKSNDIVSEFALALVKAAKQVRKGKVDSLKSNMAQIIKEIAI